MRGEGYEDQSTFILIHDWLTIGHSLAVGNSILRLKSRCSNAVANALCVT